MSVYLVAEQHGVDGHQPLVPVVLVYGVEPLAEPLDGVVFLLHLFLPAASGPRGLLQYGSVEEVNPNCITTIIVLFLHTLHCHR